MALCGRSDQANWLKLLIKALKKHPFWALEGHFQSQKCPSKQDANDDQSKQALHSDLRLAQCEVIGTDGVYELRKSDGSYTGNFASENSGLRPGNAHFWNLSIWISITSLGPTP